MQDIADELVAKVKAGVQKLTVGRPEDDCDITPVVSEASAKFIQGLVEDAKEKGAVFLTPWKRDNNLISPVLLDKVTPDMRIAWEEPFGPVLPVLRVSGIEEAVNHCNSSNLGLQGCVFTRDINTAMRVSDAMQTGTVQVGGPAGGGRGQGNNSTPCVG